MEELRKIEELLRKSASANKSAAASTARPPEYALERHETRMPIAIVGIDGVFPRCSSVGEFWRALQTEESLIEEIGSERFDWDRFSSDNVDEELTSRCRWAGLIARPFGFDAEFFSIPAQEAEMMDPRLRLLLMSVYHCLEDAGYAPASFQKTRTGLFVGVEDSEYGQSLYEMGIDAGLANAPGMIANRIAYHFDFAGASEFVNTMCSSGAVALHRACNALRSGEIVQAVVAGANIMIRPEPFWRLAEMGQISADRTIHSFGRDADGYLRADGVGSVLLKTLTQAKEDGDAIYALIRNSAVNFNGQGGLSMAAPNIAAHADLIKRCYREAGVDPREIGYIEAQGMGTPVSDMAEWHAFNRALTDLAREHDVELRDASCLISTVKPLMGHMHAASVFGALFKVIFSLQSQTIHKIQNLTEISADLDVSGRPCRLLQQNSVWAPAEKPRRAGIHSYGIGGNNAHLLIEENVPVAVECGNDVAASGRTLAVPFSARTSKQCRTLVERCCVLLRDSPQLPLDSLAYTLQVGREEFLHRVVFVTATRAGLIAQMEAYLAGRLVEGAFESPSGPQLLPVSDVSNAASKLARDWVQGGRVRWQSLHDDSGNGRKRHARQHLPLYPFELTDYRIAFQGIGSSHAVDKVSFAAIDSDSTASRPQKIRRFITLFIARAMNIATEAIDPLQDFQHFGVDSIVTVRMIRSIRSELGVPLSGRDLIECTSIDALTTYIDKKMAATSDQGSHPEAGANGIDEDQSIRDSLEKFKRGELDLGQIKELLN